MNKEIKIKIGGVDYLIKYSFRALMYFEEMADKKIDEYKENVSDLLMMFYSIIKANNKTIFNYTFDEFLDQIDMFPETVQVFTEFMQSMNDEQPQQNSNITAKKKKR